MRGKLELEDRTLAQVAAIDKSEKDNWHKVLDKMHVINRKLNELGYEEK